MTQENVHSKEKFPYRLPYRLRGGNERMSKEVHNATSSRQALVIFRKLHPWVRDYEAMGAETWVEVDNEMLIQNKEKEQQQQTMRQNKEKEINNFLQNAWWNQ